MLRKLSIRNYALIRELDLDFDSGLNIITGETGAGKSIIIGALGLILGNRADVSVLNLKNEKCIVEAFFDMDVRLLTNFFIKNELDVEDQLIIRRQINPQGKSRAFINDTPVKLPLLRELSSYLIDVNTQHQTYSLNDSITQMKMVNDYADLSVLLTEYQDDYVHYNSLKRSLKEIIEKELAAKAEEDFLQFQFDELEKAVIVKGEFNDLEQEQEILNHSEEIKSKLFESSQLLSSEEESVLDRGARIVHSLSTISQYHTDYENLKNRFESIFIELQDISQEIESIGESVDFNPGRLEELSARIDLLNHLQQKHHVHTVDDLIELKTDLENRLYTHSRLSNDKEELEEEIALLFDKLNINADKMHDSRVQFIPEVEAKVIESLSVLGMKGADFKIDINKGLTLNEFGNDEIQFLFSANKGIEVAPISKVASGGELSRLMLTLKYILTSRKSLSTIIFDEIDTGVSGDIASLVGDMMRSMGEKMQLISITHLPQIAGKADAHFKVFKKESEDTTHSSIRRLNDNERVDELSLMISGKKKSEAAIATARELME